MCKFICGYSFDGVIYVACAKFNDFLIIVQHVFITFTFDCFFQIEMKAAQAVNKELEQKVASATLRARSPPQSQPSVAKTLPAIAPSLPVGDAPEDSSGIKVKTKVQL